MKRRALTLLGLLLIVGACFAQSTSTITALPAITNPAGTDVYAVDQSGCGSGAGTCKESLTQLAAWLDTNLGLPVTFAGGGNISPGCMPSTCSATGITLNSSGIGLPASGDIVVPGAVYTNQQYTYNHSRIFLPNGELFWIDLSEGTGNTEWCAQQDNYPGPYPPGSAHGPTGGSLFFSTCGDNDGAGNNPFIGAIRSGANIAAIAIGNTTDGPNINIFMHGATVSGGASVTPTGSCGTVSTVKGGVQTGSFHSGVSGTCTATIALPDTSDAQVGWWCEGHDVTTGTIMPQTGTTNSSCTFAGTTTSGDNIVWHASGY